MESLLLQNARLGVVIRREYAKLKRDPDAKYYTYALQLQNGKWYVGNTEHIYQRLMDHLGMTPSTANWVKMHGPVQRVIEVSRNSAKEDEMYKTLQYMSKFGWPNVRGSSYCKTDLQNMPERLERFERTRDGDFDYLSAAELNDVLNAVKDLLADA